MDQWLGEQLIGSGDPIKIHLNSAPKVDRLKQGSVRNALSLCSFNFRVIV